MSTFVKTANDDYRLSFADQGKQTSPFRFPFAGNTRKFAVSVFCMYECMYVRMYVCMYVYSIYIYMCIDRAAYVLYRHIDIDIYIYLYDYIYIYILISAAVSRGKWKPRQFDLIRVPFAHRANVNVVCPFAFKETNGSYPFANGLNGLSHL
jgi:hypothetical protein